MINKVFVQQIGRNVEAYIDYRVVKSEKAKEHVKDLTKVYDVLRKFKVYIWGGSR